MICEEDLVGDMEGEDDAEAAEAPPSSPDEIFLTNFKDSLDLGLNKVLEAHGVSGVVNGVGNPEDPMLQLISPFSDNCGLYKEGKNAKYSLKFLKISFHDHTLN